MKYILYIIEVLYDIFENLRKTKSYKENKFERSSLFKDKSVKGKK